MKTITKVNLHFFIFLTYVALIFITLLSSLRDIGWPLSLLAHFRLQYIVAALFLLLFALVLKKQRLWALPMVMVIVWQAQYVWQYLWIQEPVIATSAPSLQLFLWNTWHKNHQWQEIEQYVRSQQQDIIVLQETSNTVRQQLFHYRDEYHVFAIKDSVILIKKTSAKTKVQVYPFPVGHAVEIKTILNQRPLSILATHLSPPSSLSYVAARQAQLLAIQTWAKQQTTAHIVLGDLNMTPWSNGYQNLLATTSLNSASLGFGLQVTWPFHNLFTALLAIPLDHCLISPTVTVLNSRTDKALSSNHRPLLTQVQF